MKKIAVLILFGILLCSFVAANDNSSDYGNNISSSRLDDTHNKISELNESKSRNETVANERAIEALSKSLENGKASEKSIIVRQQVIAKLEARIQLREQLAELKANYSEARQNLIRERVQSILELRNVTNESIGSQIVAIAREFNNSINKTAQEEMKIARRGAVKSFLFGGDRAAAQSLLNETAANKARINALEALKEKTDNQTAAFLGQQISALKQEQARQESVAQKAKGRGILGWLFRR